VLCRILGSHSGYAEISSLLGHPASELVNSYRRFEGFFIVPTDFSSAKYLAT